MTVVDTAPTGKNAWPPAETSSVLAGAPALMSERSVSGSLRLPGTFHGRVRMDLKTAEERPFGRRRKTRERKPGRRCQRKHQENRMSFKILAMTSVISIP